MKLFYRVTRPYKSIALRRIEDGIRLTLPDGWQLVSDASRADLIIAPVVSINDTYGLPANSVIWQLCHLSAGGQADEWAGVWSRARLVVSYLKLPWSYLRMPLGYDPVLFNPAGRHPRPKYDLVVTGYVDEAGGGEVISRLVGHFRKVIHLGKNMNLDSFRYTHVEGVSDTQLAEIYRNSRYVAGLRLIEGFELPIIEGAACGCQPITLDLECYRRWFDGLAFLVDPHNLDEELAAISQNRIEIANRDASRFTWQVVMKKFWDAVRELK